MTRNNAASRRKYLDSDEKYSTVSGTTIVSASARINHPVHLGEHVEIQRQCLIGAFSFVNQFTTIYSHTSIGRFCSIGRFAEIGAPAHPTDYLSTHQFQYTDAEFRSHPQYRQLQGTSWPYWEQSTTIGHDVWIGSKAIIVAGITVGHGAVVGAGSVVTRDVAPYSIVAGCPARLLRSRFSPEVVQGLLKVAWWDLPIKMLCGLPFDRIDACLARLMALRSGAAKEQQP